MATATYEVHIGWDPLPAATAFKLGTSTFNGSWLIYHPYNPSFAGANDNVTTDVKSFRIIRGREDDLAQFSAGTATLVMKEPNKLSGKYNAKNSSSPLFGLLRPMRPVRIRATFSSITYGLFYGFITNIDYRPDEYLSVISCADAFEVMNRNFPVIPQLGGLKTQQALWYLMEGCDIPEAFRWSLATANGDSLPTFSTDGNQSGLLVAQNLLEVERGDFFFGKDGVAKYQPRSNRVTTASPTAMPSGLGPTPRGGVDIALVRNIARAQRTAEGAEVQEFRDEPSIAQYGPVDYGGVISSPYLRTDAQAMSLCGYLVQKRKDPLSKVWDATFSANRSSALMVAGLAREIGDYVSITEPLATGNYWVESIIHEVSEGGLDHRVSFGLSERVAADTPFRIGVSTLGPSGTDTLVWANG